MKNKTILAVTLLLIACITHAVPNTYWLTTNAQADGSIQSQNSVPIATDFQATASSLETLIYKGDTTSSFVTNGLAFLLAYHNNTTEQLARIIQIQAQVTIVDQLLLDKLLSRINSDGGIGPDSGFSSNVLDSSWALLAFAIVDNIDSQIISNLLAYILNQKQIDKGYAHYQTNDSSVYVSSLVCLALNKYKTTFNLLISDIQSVNQFIIDKQLADGGWGDLHENALAIIALSQSNYDSSAYWISVQQLRGAQTGTTTNNTHWNEEVYTTALALIANDLTEHMTIPSNYGSITAIVVDSISNQVINGAFVSMDSGAKTDDTNSQGVFHLGNISNGSHGVEISYLGYLTENISFDLQSGENKNLGIISLVKTPATSLIKGVMIDGNTRNPINNAQIEVVSDATYNTTTDTQGRFQLEVNPGNFTLTATKRQYNGLQATSAISAGEIIDFNLSAYPIGVVVDKTEITGRIITNETNLPIANATITIANTDYFSSANGEFQISDLPIGQTTILITASGYQSLSINAYLTGGTVNLGNVLLFANANTSSAIYGVIQSNITNQGLANVNISIVDTNLSASSEQDGSYQITDIQNSNYQVQFSFPSYQGITYQISSQQHASTELNLTLSKLNSSPITVTEFLPERFEYKGAQEVELDIELLNSSHQVVKTRLFIRVKNSNDEIMSYYPVKEVPSNGVLDDALDSLLANQYYTTNMSWSTRFMSPDTYTIDLLVYAENGIDLLTQGSTSIEVLPAKVASGKVLFNPEHINFDPSQQIDITAQIYSSGNQSIGNVDVTADVYLVDKKDNSNDLTLTLLDEFTDPLLSRSYIMHKNTNGELLIYNNLTILKFKTDETFESFINVGNIQDFDINDSNQIFTLDYLCMIKKYDSDGTLLNSISTGINQCRKIELLNDGTLHFISDDSGIYNYNPISGVVEHLVGSYFENPQGILKHSDGRMLIADGDSNSILLYQNNEITTWINGLSNPHGLCEDIDGTVLVANYGSNEIIRVHADGSTSVVNNTIQKPFDIKRNLTGGYYVSSEQDNTIYQLDTNGTTSVIYESFIKKPTVIISGNNYDEYIYNSLDKSIVHRLSDGTTSIVMTASNVVNAMTIDANDRLIIAMTDNVYRLEADSSLTALSSTNINVKRIESTNNLTEFLVYLTDSKIQVLDTISQTVSDYIQSPFNRIIGMQTDSTGVLYILDNQGNLTTVNQNMDYQIVKTGLGTPLDMFITNSDEIYIAKGDKNIIKLDNTYSIIQTTQVANLPYNFVINSNGDVLYSNQTKTIFKHDGTIENVYVTTSENIKGDIAINSVDSLLITFNTSNIERIDSSLTKTTIASGVYGLESIVMDNTGGVWVSYNSGVFYLDVNNSITATHTSTNTPRLAKIAIMNNQFFMANNTVLHQFDSSFNFMKKYSGFTNIYDFDRLSNNDIIISSSNRLLRYTSQAKLAELLKSDNYYHVEEKDNTHLFILSYHKLLELDLTTGNTLELYDGSNDTDITINGNKIYLTKKNDNSFTELNFSGVKQFEQYGLVSLQGMTVDENNTLYFNDYYGVYKWLSINNAEKVEGLEGVGYMDYHSGVIYKSNTHRSKLVVKDLISGNISRYSTGAVSSLAYLSNNELLISSPNGLNKYKIDGLPTNLLSNVNKITDIVQKNNGKIYLMNGSSSGGILELIGNVVSQYKNKDELLNMYSYSLGGDNNFLYINDVNSIIQVNDTGIRKIITPIKLTYSKDSIEIIDTNIYMINKSKLYKFELHDPLTSLPAIGDLVHSSIINITLENIKQEVNFTPFTAPIPGDYEVRLSFSDTDILTGINQQIHIGSVATGLIQIPSNVSVPGDINLPTYIAIDGVDIDTYVSINPDELLAIDTGSTPNFFNSMMDDNGDIYYISGNQNVIHRIDNITKADTIIYNSPEFISKILKDSSGNIILLGYYSKAFWIEADGTISKIIDFGLLTGNTGLAVGDIDFDDNLIIKKRINNLHPLFKINTNTNTSTLIHPNIPTNNRNLWVSGNGNYFLVGNGVNVYNPISQSLAIRRETIVSEGEHGNNSVVVCEDTLIYSEPILGEEEDLFAGARRSLIFHYDGADIDGITYDRNRENLLLHGHNASWSTLKGLYSLPVHCGKIYVELHLIDQTNTSLNGFDIPPDQTIEVGLNTHEYIWKIDELDTVQKLFNFQTQIDDLLPNESRPILSGAYLKFKNGLDPQQDLIVNLDIPSILGVVNRDLTVNLDNTQYQGNTDIQITATVNNTASSVFNGKVLQHIEDANGNLVETLAQQNITNLAAQSQLDIPVVWNTQTYYAGEYHLVSQLFDNTDNLQDQMTTAFTLIASEINTSPVELHLLTNKAQYATIDLVELSSSVTNLSDNNIINDYQAQLLVTDPNGVVIYQQTVAVNNLSPQAIQSWQQSFNLNQAIIGTYTISLNLIDNNGIIVTNNTTTIEVVLDAQISLSGIVTVANDTIQPPTTNSCHYEITNTAVQNISGIEIHQMVVNLSNQLTMQDDVITINLNPNETWTNDQTIDTSALSSGDHACILRTFINAQGTIQETTQASAIFFVQGANQLSGMVWNDTNGNAIIDNAEVGINNIELKLYDNAQQLLQTITTANNGLYQFAAIANGQYSIEVTQSGTIATYLITTANNPAALNVNNGHQSINFGYQTQIGSASGIIWNDENANQIIDNGETFYPNIDINLLDSSNTVVDTTQSDVDGIFAFLDKATGQYTLSVVDDTGVLLGLNNTTNNNPQSIDIMTPPQVSDTFFGYRQDINDISVDDSACLIAINENTPINMTINVKNLGNTNINQAIFVNSLSIGLNNVSWSCQAYDGASCSASGANTINDTIDLPQGSSLVYTIHADVTAVLQDSINTSYTLTMPNGISDDNPANNSGQKSYKVLYLQNPDKLFDSSFECIPITTMQMTKTSNQTINQWYKSTLEPTFQPWLTNGKLWIQIYKQLQTIAQQQAPNNLLTITTKPKTINNWNSYTGEPQ